MRHTLSKLISALILTIIPCEACTIIENPTRVGPAFRVEVRDQGRPVKGLGVKLYGSNLILAETDPNGVATFRNVPSGSYHLSPDHDSGSSFGVAIEVSPAGPTGRTFRLGWPGKRPIAVRSLNGIMKGTIHASSYLPGESQPVYLLDLMEGLSGKLLKTTQTSAKGDFRFEDVASGFYFLNLRAPFVPADSGDLMAVTVDQSASIDHLEIDFGSTSCGFWYSERSQCSQSNLHIQRLSGKVTDVVGSAIPNATLRLYDESQIEVERLNGDIAGRFDSPFSLAGTYELLVTAPGFAPLRSTVVAAPPGAFAQSSLTLQLSVGACNGQLH